MAKTNAKPTPAKGEETIAGYFRKVFRENPKLLRGRSNEELLRRWLADHPGEKEVPNRVKQSLSNIKSVLRKKGRKRKAKVQPGEATTTAPSPAEAMPMAAKKASHSLEPLEEQIDDCLSLAKHLDREGLAHVIQLLRRAQRGGLEAGPVGGRAPRVAAAWQGTRPLRPGAGESPAKAIPVGQRKGGFSFRLC